MSKDPITQAREALRDAVALLPAVESDVAGPLAEALKGLATSLDGIERVEGRLAAQLALLDDRLLRIENNRIFSAWRSLMSQLARLRGRRASDQPDAGEYPIWVAHEDAAMRSATGVPFEWGREPFFSILPLDPGTSVEGLPYSPSFSYELGADYVCLIRGGGRLTSRAPRFMAEALQTQDADVLYGDEDRIDAAGVRSSPTFRPGWSPDLMTSYLYTGSLLVVSNRVFMEVGGLRANLGPAQLHDFALRATDRARKVVHVPRILYHQQVSQTEVPEQTRTAIEESIRRREQRAAEAIPGPVAGSVLIRRQGPDPEITAVICSKSPGLLATCLTSLRNTAGSAIRKVIVIAHEENGPNHGLRQVVQRYGGEAVPYTGAFNFAVMNNLGAAQAITPHLLFLNDDIRATAGGWAELLVSHLFTERIGVAGAVLRYPTGEIQHAGIVSGINDGVGHVGRYSNGSEVWPWLLMTRNVSAVTGACLAIRTDTFRSLDGFDPEFPNNYNDVDLCFRAREAGLDVVCVPVSGLIHAECQTRPGLVRFQERYRLFRKWGHILSRVDPYYSPSLAPTEQIRLDLGAKAGFAGLLT
jgi:GT2 family glycosyltransferase